MRYWVYKDAEILGPYGPEDLEQAGGLHPETLVCEEDSGRKDSDWKCLSDVPGLSGLRLLPAPGPLGEDALAPGDIALEALGTPSEAGPGDWISGLFDSPESRRLWGREGELKSAAAETGELSAANARIEALNAELAALKARLADLDKPRELLPPPPAAPAPRNKEDVSAAPTPFPYASAPRNKEDVSAAPTPFPYASAPAPAAPPPVRTPFKLAAPKTFQVVEPPVAAPPAPEPVPEAPAEPEAAAAPEISPPSLGFSGKGVPFKLGGGPSARKKEGGPAGLKFGETKSFRVRPQEPGFLAQTAPAAQPAAEEAAPKEPEPAPKVFLEPPPPTLAPTPAPATLPPMTVSFKSPVVELFPSATPPPVPAPPTAPPGVLAGPRNKEDVSAAPTPFPYASAPTLPPAPAALPPMTLSFSPAAPSSAPETAEVLARLAKPAPPPPTAEKPKRSGPPRKLLIAGFALLGGLLATGFLFFRNTRDLKTMVNMGADQKPLGNLAPEEAERHLPPLKPRVAEPPQAPAPPPAQPSPEPARQSPPDPGQAAIDLVKSYPLDGGRGSVGQWLQYSFTANPGADNKEEWTAGALGGTLFAVQYRLLRQGKSSRESINYVFDADTSRKTVQGKNAAARDLLAGTPPAARRKRAVKIKPARKRAAKRRPSAPAKKAVPLLPLPSDSELLPPAEGDASFTSDTIQ